MTTIFIRFKNLLIFGLLLLSLSIVWFALTSPQQERKNVVEEEGSAMQENTDSPTSSAPSITIVPEQKETTDDFFSEYRLERERTRSEQMEIFNEIINNPNTNTEVRLDAQEKLLMFTDNLGKETKIENTLLAKGFSDAVVAIESEAVMVIVPSQGLRQDEVARIADLVVKIADCKMEDVVIVPRAP